MFRDYTGDALTFDKTSVTVNLYKSGTEFLSRSQARRLLAGLENSVRSHSISRALRISVRGLPMKYSVCGKPAIQPPGVFQEMPMPMSNS